MIRSTVAAAVLPLLFATAAAAQAPVPAPPPEEPAPAQAQAQAAAHEFHGTLNGGVQLQQGSTDAWGGSFDANVSRPYSPRGTFVARANVDYAKVVVSDNPRIVKTQNDRGTLAGGINQTFSTHGIVMARSLFLRDSVHKITYRFEQLAGAGIRYSHPNGKLDVTFIPGISLLKEDTFLSASFERGWQAGAGFYQQLSTHFDERWSFEDTFSYRRTFEYNEYSIESVASLTGRLTKVMGLQVEYQYVRENLVPPGVKPHQQILTMGLQFRF